MNRDTTKRKGWHQHPVETVLFAAHFALQHVRFSFVLPA
jgi:hypothetical protein